MTSPPLKFPPHLMRELPGLESAFDADGMRGRLQAALFGGSRWTLERCEPDSPLFLPGEGCTLQYECVVRDAADGELLDPIVVGRVFPDAASCARYMRQKLAPLVERVRKRADLATFVSPAAVIEPLHMLVHVWPLDGELPTLVDATDPRLMAGVLGRALAGRFAVADCRVERVSYRRRSRCVLRYTLSGRPARSGGPSRLVVYGKLTPRGDDALYGKTVSRLREYCEARRNGDRIVIPRSLGWRPELGLALLEEVPGEAKVGTALRARLKDKPPGDGPTLEAMLSACVRVATTLHGSGLPLGRSRPLADRLADLEREVEITRLFSPEYAERASGWLGRLADHARRLEAEAFRLCHGDFKYAQLLFDGDAVGLLDLDNLCQAEPALDLGQFFAYLRAQARSSKRAASVSSTLEDELCERFLDEYASAMGIGAEPVARLRARATMHEVASLLRMALHSQQKLKLERLESATALLEERLGTLD
jgi:thiamine kinase-like enzyme